MSLLNIIIKLFEIKENITEVSEGILVGNLPRNNCLHCKTKLNLIYTSTKGFSYPRGFYHCPDCTFVYDLPIR